MVRGPAVVLVTLPNEPGDETLLPGLPKLGRLNASKNSVRNSKRRFSPSGKLLNELMSEAMIPGPWYARGLTSPKSLAF
jgi:hypothetical protein